ncbi:hypothetical protein HGM15179_013564 [Zosterops borbonicus]|uniref:Uncharacterized protein n=1 Tax=Zosterops borbonicus TaxID=364589 RepID=A0A8K1G8X4_9PASS|nr:hypothetical protein HGM15179_013564 [Zosterops borbonicus]
MGYLSTFHEDSTKLSGAVDMPEGLDAIRRNLNKIKKWNHGNLIIRFNKTKRKVLHLSQGSHGYQHRLGDEQIKSSLAERGLGVLVDERLDMTWPCALAGQKAKSIKSSMASRLREVTLPLCSGGTPPAVLHPALGSSLEEEPGLTEAVQMPMKMIRKLENLSYKYSLRKLGLFSLEKRNLRGYFIAVI